MRVQWRFGIGEVVWARSRRAALRRRPGDPLQANHLQGRPIAAVRAISSTALQLSRYRTLTVVGTYPWHPASGGSAASVFYLSSGIRRVSSRSIVPAMSDVTEPERFSSGSAFEPFKPRRGRKGTLATITSRSDIGAAIAANPASHAPRRSRVAIMVGKRAFKIDPLCILQIEQNVLENGVRIAQRRLQRRTSEFCCGAFRGISSLAGCAEIV